jgi:hypothetical protein
MDKISARQKQLCIPRAFRMTILESIHEVHHNAFIKCLMQMKQRFYWKNLPSDLNLFIKGCLVCQQIKNHPPGKFPLQSLPVGSLFETWQIDYHTVRTGKHKNKDGYAHIFVAIEQLSQFIVLVPSRTQAAGESAQLFFDHVILKYGCPKRIISDRSTSWLNIMFQKFLSFRGMQIFHIRTSA